MYTTCPLPSKIYSSVEVCNRSLVWRNEWKCVCESTRKTAKQGLKEQPLASTQGQTDSNEVLQRKPQLGWSINSRSHKRNATKLQDVAWIISLGGTSKIPQMWKHKQNIADLANIHEGPSKQNSEAKGSCSSCWLLAGIKGLVQTHFAIPSEDKQQASGSCSPHYTQVILSQTAWALTLPHCMTVPEYECRGWNLSKNEWMNSVLFSIKSLTFP